MVAPACRLEVVLGFKWAKYEARVPLWFWTSRFLTIALLLNLRATCAALVLPGGAWFNRPQKLVEQVHSFRGHFNPLTLLKMVP